MKNKRGQANIPIINNFILLFVFMLVILAAGIVVAVIYYDMTTIRSVLETINFQLPIESNISNPYNITDFQGILGITAYPLLGLSSSLPYLTYFMIFAFIISLGITAYISSRNPVFFILHLLFLLLETYLAIIMSNVFVEVLSNPIMNQLLTPFTIYVFLMVHLPAIVFFTGLLFGAISFTSIMKPQSNRSGNYSSLNYGGDY